MSSCRTRDFPEGWPDTSGDGGSEFIEGWMIQPEGWGGLGVSEGWGGNGIATETI